MWPFFFLIVDFLVITPIENFSQNTEGHYDENIV